MARICAAVEIPVYVDADTGFGGVNNVRQMVRAFEAAGVAGLFISDQVFPNRCGYLPGKQIVPVEQMLAKVKAALDARRDPDLFIAARTDAAGVEGVESAIARCQLFMEAGADMAKPMGVDTIAEIKRVLREVGGPHMATLSQAAGPKARSLEELEAAGVCSATFPSVALFAAAQAVRNVLRTAQARQLARALPGASHPARRLLRARRPQAAAGARGELRQGRGGAGAQARGGIGDCSVAISRTVHPLAGCLHAGIELPRARLGRLMGIAACASNCDRSCLGISSAAAARTANRRRISTRTSKSA